MLISDESCNSEKTILRYQENGIADLLSSDWYGIMLLSPGGTVYFDNYNDVHGIGNELPQRFVENCVEWNELLIRRCLTYEFEGWYFLLYSIRQTDKGNCVFFLHCRKSSPYDERDRKWYEIYSITAQQRMLLENELVQEKNYLSSILDSTESCIAVVDMEYNIISANDGANMLFGKNLKAAPSGEMLSLIKAVDRVLSLKEKVTLPRTIFRDSNNEFGFSIYKFVLTPLRSSKGKVACAVVVATDITYDFINKRCATQKQNFLMAGNMNFEVAKDMRTPLMNIQGCASLLMDTVGDSEENRELLTFIKDEVNNIRQINERLTSFINISEKNTFAQININDILRNCVSALYKERMKRKLTVETGFAENIPLVRAQNVDLQQVFFNLLLSCFEGSREKGKIRVTSQFDSDTKRVIVKFIDDGENDEVTERQYYLQINGRKPQGWIDIPFLLAKKIILDYGGTLLTSSDEKGCNVRTVLLPCLE